MRRKNFATTLDAKERAMLKRARRYVKQMTGIDSDAEALRYLVRCWEPR